MERIDWLAKDIIQESFNGRIEVDDFRKIPCKCWKKHKDNEDYCRQNVDEL